MQTITSIIPTNPMIRLISTLQLLLVYSIDHGPAPRNPGRKAKVDNSSGMLYNSMVIGKRSLNHKQQAPAMEIVATLRPKPAN
ncbi:hypothetical protein DIU31_028590 [Mucilaginibacter rubeus]|uniref:Uncharacterized protein n=1 Tax=Mucilaginibacter rubeus TaxID=2027860 RepID=A0AAE6ML08_9SPHI|nr:MULTISPECIES: hypothetical protein [Mucilaginibacter]QEM07265.1 hypothetical protein DIU31_028590 [Mucilaginibacter rubeus]QEM19720.1 hypothetical protein DIU38_028165 [Mucilaginibacter gossypii]QTE43582.1 hypothetical protein J3L19_32460 [Mucilaginibacter rubeus]QTE50182.1 hypothetical protein J3L21_32415 [Mucilaginibacter rubeus]QTE55270.1 hypothetical protein J3L23_24035 [Mucilaginibacter rubeus]